MHPYLESIIEQIERANPADYPPPVEVKDEDVVIGHAAEFTQKTWSALAATARRMEQLRVDAKYSLPSRAHWFAAEIQRETCDTKLLNELFWNMLRVDANDQEHNIGIRSKWEIVRPREEADSFLSRVVNRFRGQKPEEHAHEPEDSED